MCQKQRIVVEYLYRGVMRGARVIVLWLRKKKTGCVHVCGVSVVKV